jgi:hypothetical protein
MGLAVAGDGLEVTGLVIVIDPDDGLAVDLVNSKRSSISSISENCR